MALMNILCPWWVRGLCTLFGLGKNWQKIYDSEGGQMRWFGEKLHLVPGVRQLQGV